MQLNICEGEGGRAASDRGGDPVTAAPPTPTVLVSVASPASLGQGQRGAQHWGAGCWGGEAVVLGWSTMVITPWSLQQPCGSNFFTGARP